MCSYFKLRSEFREGNSRRRTFSLASTGSAMIAHDSTRWGDSSPLEPHRVTLSQAVTMLDADRVGRCPGYAKRLPEIHSAFTLNPRSHRRNTPPTPNRIYPLPGLSDQCLKRLNRPQTSQDAETCSSTWGRVGGPRGPSLSPRRRGAASPKP